MKNRFKKIVLNKKVVRIFSGLLIIIGVGSKVLAIFFFPYGWSLAIFGIVLWVLIDKFDENERDKVDD